MLSKILWAHPDSVKLFNTFRPVLIMDSTYKINKYRLPLLEFICTTCTGKTYFIAVAFFTEEREENFVWALQSVRSFLRCPEDVKVIVIDRDQALMNDVDIIFPNCTALLCRYHILSNVEANFIKKAKLGKKARRSEVWRNVRIIWENIMDSESEEEYNSCLETFRECCQQWPEFLEYIE
ncbi:protein FAR1-RELATED SEQUENCE 5-like, partial [Trifolium medium]|nr:protein FAR1-RELATED SEQUENCE 5-like [Trifolium medium]